jgi:hypothetical protein
MAGMYQIYILEEVPASACAMAIALHQNQSNVVRLCGTSEKVRQSV